MGNNVKKMWIVRVTDAQGNVRYVSNPLSPEVARFTGTTVSELTPNVCDAELYWRKDTAEEECERFATDLPQETDATFTVDVVAVDVTITESA